MKYSISGKTSKSAKRFLTAASKAFFSLLCKKTFEQITVGEICEECDYPRATFYNYFEDKYDLLGFFWQLISRQVKLDGDNAKNEHEAMELYFNRLYDLLCEYEESIRRMLEHNPRDGYFFASCKIYLTSKMSEILAALPEREDCPVPRDIIAEHYSNTLLLIFGKRFEKNAQMSKDDTYAYLEYLLLPTERRP